MRIFTLFVAILTIKFCSATTHSSCPNQPEFVDVNVTGCTDQPCKLISGKSAEIQLKILSKDYTTWMKTEIKAHAMGTDVTYPLPNDDVCSFLTDAECPLDKGELVNYRVLFPVLKSFPLVPVVVTFIVNSDKGVQGCMKMALEVVAA